MDTANPDPDVNEVATLVEHCYAGEPDTQDVMFRAKMRCAADAVDHGAGGFRLFVPLVPFTAEAIAHAGELLGRVHELTGIRCSSTMNVLGPDIVDFAVMMRFEPNHEQTRSADRALDLLYELFAEAGFVPYRLDVDHAEWIDRLDPDPAARHFARWLKQELDPNNVIAPGRYG